MLHTYYLPTALMEDHAATTTVKQGEKKKTMESESWGILQFPVQPAPYVA